MILNGTPQDQAVMSNVGAIGEFRIRNSAKAFSILSSGLYSNKIRAVIRELSCNALDSHVAAKNTSIPFVLHLPNSLEPYFSVRDFGTGLTHDQVTQIYTTYFESTKTTSNEFIGALGLGSKSPFSYTDNFTVTAVKDGRKGIYTAFINDQGVPSIALMMEEQTTEPSGVEVKFSVNERWDFSKFRDEARHVFRYWKNRPTVTGNADFEFTEPKFKDSNIVPGVHSLHDGYHSVAIMGNIAYPIEVPNEETTLGNLRHLLSCGLVMEFGIGELDFSASREGLSYVALTIDSIKRKLEVVNAQLAVHLTAEADKITNMWDRTTYLYKRMDDALWRAAVAKYVTDTKFPLLNVSGNRWNALVPFTFRTEKLAADYNITIRAFSKSRNQNTSATIKAEITHDRNAMTSHTEWSIRPEDDRYFVFNDTKVGAIERAKFHWRSRTQVGYTETVYVLEQADKTKPMKQTEFLNAIMNPPAQRVMQVSSLLQKERESNMGKNVTILCLEDRQTGYYNRRNTTVWADAGKASDFDANTTYYYLPLSGYTSLGIVEDVKFLKEKLSTSGLYSGQVYGVRKGDMEFIKTQANWINLDTMIVDKLSKLDNASVMAVVKESIGFNAMYQWKVLKSIDATSPYATFYETFKGVKDAESQTRSSLEYLCRNYKIATTVLDPSALIEKYSAEIEVLRNRYPLLKALNRYTESADVAEYINMVDKVKPV